ncbi:hypothetical protein FACS1894180_8270 [Bacteroidia bacterium]|nr:hypothetical protein FACS1894180_8270 [Bacteroidia bacterium]
MNKNTGCTGTVSRNAIVVNNAITVDVQPNNVTAACSGTQSTFALTTNAGDQDFLWTVSGGGSFIVGANNQPTVTVQWGTAGTASLTLSFKNGYCTANWSSNIIINNVLQPQINASANNVCTNQPVVYSSTVTAPTYS